MMSGVPAAVDGSFFVFTGDYYLPSSTSVTGSYDSYNASTSYTDAFPRMIYWQPSQGNPWFRVIQNPFSTPSIVYTTYDGANSLQLFNIGAPGQSDSGVQRSLPNMFMLPNSKKLVYSATKNSNDTVNNCIGVSFETTPGVTSSWQHKLAYEWHEAGKKIGRLEYQVVVVNGVSTETCYVGIMDANVTGGIAETGMQLYSFVLPANNQLQQSDFKLVDLEPDDDQTPGTGVSSFGVFKNGDILYRNNFHTKQTYRVAGVPPVPGGFADQSAYDAAKLAVGGDSEITKVNYDKVLELWNLKTAVEPDVSVLPPPTGSPAVAPAKALYDAMKSKVLNSGGGTAGTAASSGFATFADLAKMATVTGRTAKDDSDGATGLITFREAEAVRLLLDAANYADAVKLTSANFSGDGSTTGVTRFIQAGAQESDARFPSLAELADAVRASGAENKSDAETAAGDRETYLFAHAVRTNTTAGVGPTTAEYSAVKERKATVAKLFPRAETAGKVTKLALTDEGGQHQNYAVAHTNAQEGTSAPFAGTLGDLPLRFLVGNTYELTYPAGHELQLQTTPHGQVETDPAKILSADGVTVTPESNKLTIVVSAQHFSSHKILYYQCKSHPAMGGSIAIQEPLTVANFKTRFTDVQSRIKVPGGTAPNTDGKAFDTKEALELAVTTVGVPFVQNGDQATLAKMTADGQLTANKANELRAAFGVLANQTEQQSWNALVYAASTLGQNQSAATAVFQGQGVSAGAAARALNQKWNAGGTVVNEEGDGVRFDRFSNAQTDVPVYLLSDGTTLISAANGEDKHWGRVHFKLTQPQQLYLARILSSKKLSGGVDAKEAERPQKMLVAGKNEDGDNWRLLQSESNLAFAQYGQDAEVDAADLLVQAAETATFKQFLFVVFGATAPTEDKLHLNEIQLFAGTGAGSNSLLKFEFPDLNSSSGKLNVDRDAQTLRQAHTLTTTLKGSSNLDYQTQDILAAANIRADPTLSKVGGTAAGADKTDAAILTDFGQKQVAAAARLPAGTSGLAALSLPAFAGGFQTQRDYQMAQGIGVTKNAEIQTALNQQVFKDLGAKDTADVVRVVRAAGHTSLAEAVATGGIQLNVTGPMQAKGWTQVAEVPVFQKAKTLLQAKEPSKAEAVARARAVLDLSGQHQSIIAEVSAGMTDDQILALMTNQFEEKEELDRFEVLVKAAKANNPSKNLSIATFKKGFTSNEERTALIAQYGGNQDLTMMAIRGGFVSEAERLLAKQMGFNRKSRMPLQNSESVREFYDRRTSGLQNVTERSLALFSKVPKTGQGATGYDYKSTTLSQRQDEFRIVSATPIAMEANEIVVRDSEDVNDQTEFRILATLKRVEARLKALETAP